MLGFFIKKHQEEKEAEREHQKSGLPKRNFWDGLGGRKKESRKPEAPKPDVLKPDAVKLDTAKPDATKPVYCFVDSGNMFWGGRESLGFKINYMKLKQLLEKRFGVTKIFYYGGVRIFDFEYSILDKGRIDLKALYSHLKQLQTKSEPKDMVMIQKSLDKINFYQKLEEFGYEMEIKPAKVFYDEDDDSQEKPMLKANCDVDMTFDMMRLMEQYSGVVAMTGDGDFTAVLNYLKNHSRTLFVIGRQQRTAKEIREVAGDNYSDFENMRSEIEFRDRKD